MALLSRRSILVAAIIVVSPLRAQNVTPRPEKRVAIRGYDPVAYFTDSRATKGSPEFAAGFDDATYWFASAQHRDTFLADPDRYAPQFGGLCAIMVSQGKSVDPDPEAWAIADGKLYLFRAKEGVPVFKEQTASIVEKAADQWQIMHHKN
jgi:YHS domain-containing protein